MIPDDDNLQLPDLEAQNKLSRTPCSCLVASNQCLAGRGIATMAINKLPTFSCSVNTAAFIAAVLIPVCAMLVPMYLSDRIRDISTTGILGETLRSSTRLVITESISIGCTLPLLSDMFMSRITAPASRRAEVMTLSTRHRLICILTSSGASVLYISLSDCYFMAYLYIVMNRTKVGQVGHSDRSMETAICDVNCICRSGSGGGGSNLLRGVRGSRGTEHAPEPRPVARARAALWSRLLIADLRSALPGQLRAERPGSAGVLCVHLQLLSCAGAMVLDPVAALSDTQDPGQRRAEGELVHAGLVLLYGDLRSCLDDIRLADLAGQRCPDPDRIHRGADTVCPAGHRAAYHAHAESRAGELLLACLSAS